MNGGISFKTYHGTTNFTLPVFISIFVFLAQICKAQTSVKICFFDSVKHPVENVLVEVNNKIYESTKNQIIIPASKEPITVFKFGYKTLSYLLSNLKTDTILLNKLEININEITITGSAPNNKTYLFETSRKQKGMMKHHFSQDSAYSFILKIDSNSIVSEMKKILSLSFDISNSNSNEPVWVKYRLFNNFEERNPIPYSYTKALVNKGKLIIDISQTINDWNIFFFEFKVLQSFSATSFQNSNQIVFRVYPQTKATTWLYDNESQQTKTYRKTEPNIYFNLGADIKYKK